MAEAPLPLPPPLSAHLLRSIRMQEPEAPEAPAAEAPEEPSWAPRRSRGAREEAEDRFPEAWLSSHGRQPPRVARAAQQQRF